MRIATKPFGTVNVDERQVIDFSPGIFGFDDHRQWVLLDSSQPPFYWLQSLSQTEVAFVLISPFYFRPDYSVNLTDEDKRQLGLTNPTDLLIFSIVNIPPDHRQMTANLQGPLVINKVRRIGKQAIQTDPRWKIKHLIVQELSATGVR